MGSTQCYRDAEKALFGKDDIDELTNQTVKLYREKCNCLPACTAIKYDAYIDRTKFDFARVSKAIGVFDSNFKEYDET